MTIPKIQWTPEGLVLPQTSEILQGAMDDMDAAFGGGINRALETPQGQLASSLSAIVSEKNDEIASIVNQVDPDKADGFMQDAIARIYFLTRKPAESTIVMCECTGAARVSIVSGSRAKDLDGNIYRAVDGGTIPESGSVMVKFAAEVPGPIACPANTLVQIYQAVPGWDMINNPTGGILGRYAETRSEFEYRRRNSVALHGRSSLIAVRANVFALDGVLDVYAYENPGNDTITIGATDYPLAPHSLLVSVVGGKHEEIIKAIWNKKDTGCDYNGNKVGIVYDEEGYAYPQPSYEVRYLVPDSLNIFFRVQIRDNDALPIDIEDRIKRVVADAFLGLDGGTRARIGTEVYASRFYGAVSQINSYVSIIEINVGTTNPADQNSVAVGVDQFPTTSTDSVTVVRV
ncbi:MAG: baseplate J/gp47 family protein [Burkholderiaceae bacterium]|jgi:uncharacterized phage protein gp47/JayE|nr:baseplate J/gp47 family protein [Burkholderiaceae bacterium]